MKKIIAVCGSDSDDPSLSEFALRCAEEVGYLVAERGGVLICGGGGGVMEAACRGARKAKGLTIGILPEDKEYANPFVEVCLTTHLGRARNYIIVRSADVVVGIAGRWGTLNEIALSLNVGKPTVVIRGTGGWADILAKKDILTYLKSFCTLPIVANSAKEAVDIAFEIIDKRR